MLGGLRSSAQMISYELSLGLCFVIAIVLAQFDEPGRNCEAQKDMWFAVIQPVGALVFLDRHAGEVNRAPFDMPEAEQELTAGYHSEYSGMKFALFFMAEYQKMIVISMIAATLFFGGYREILVPERYLPERGCDWTIGRGNSGLVPWSDLSVVESDRPAVRHDLDPRHLAAHPL